MADGPDERIVAGLRRLVGDLRGSDKFAPFQGRHPESRSRCFVCGLCYGCHMDWTCPTQEFFEFWDADCYRSCTHSGSTGEDDE